jgi:hypothetical protein
MPIKLFNKVIIIEAFHFVNGFFAKLYRIFKTAGLEGLIFQL